QYSSLGGSERCVQEKSETTSSCAKDEPIPEETQKNTLTDVVRDNFGLTYLLTALHKSGLNKTLMETGPYLSLITSDAADEAT
ncbi:hypothetical protein ACQ4LD_21085, partial [Sphingobacterium daejeonense]